MRREDDGHVVLPLRAPPLRGAAVIAPLLVLLAFLDNFAMLPTVAPYATALGATPSMVGLAVAAYSVTNLPLNLAGGVLLDRVGRREVAVAGFVIAAFSLLLHLLVSTPAALIAVRMLHGVGGGLLLPAVFAITADTTVRGHHGRMMGRVGAVIGAAAVVGPLLAGTIRSLGGFSGVFVAVATIAACGALVTHSVVREPEQARVVEHTPNRPSWGGALGTVGIPVLAFTIAFGTLAAFLPTAAADLGAAPAVVGGLFAILAAVAGGIMISPIAAWVDRHGVLRPAVCGLTIIALALVLMATAGNVLTLAAATTAFGAGFGVIFPSVSAAVAIYVPPSARGRAYGAFSALYSIGFVIGPPVAGWAQEGTGVSPFATTAAIVLACLIAMVLLTIRSGVQAERHGDGLSARSSATDGPRDRPRPAQD